ncbi:hypothetical protein [Streptomyces thermolilacinus]|uniref:hypothetical protein n=1 Tax=Streptomyces thermolilacinus TaxID=285540 RepID=UPI003406B705
MVLLGPRDRLPERAAGAMLDVLEHEDGWVGHVQLVTGRPASDIDKAAAAIEDAFDLLVGSVVVDSGGSGAEIWAYQRPCAARHHRLRPMSVRQRGQLDADGFFDGDRATLQDWAHKYAHVWKAMREGGTVDTHVPLVSQRRSLTVHASRKSSQNRFS